MIARYFIKSLLLNKSLLGWGIGFMAFWIFMGAFVFGFNTDSRSGALAYTSIWFSLIGLISGSVVATSIAHSVYYANSSLSYAFRYTKLKPISYISEMMISASLVTALIGGVVILLSAGMFSAKAGYFLLPTYPEISLVVLLTAGIFIFLLSCVLVLFANNSLGLKSISFIALLPQLLSYLFGFSELGVPLPSYIIYASPFSEIPRLLFQTYYGEASPLGISSMSGPTLNPYLLSAGLLFWIVVLFMLAIYLIRRVRSGSIEEARQI